MQFSKFRNFLQNLLRYLYNFFKKFKQIFNFFYNFIKIFLFYFFHFGGFMIIFPSWLRILLIIPFFYSFLFASAEKVTILFVNDSHSHLAPSSPRDENLNGKIGGFARLATAVLQVYATDEDALFLHSGDYSIGDLFYNKFFGVPELIMLKSLGLDAMTLGNHEFDLTPYLLLVAFDSAFVDGQFPVLSANAVFTDTTVNALGKYIKPFIIKKVRNLRVGIFGLTTPSTNMLSNPSPIFIDTNIFEIAQNCVSTLRSAGADIVICLSHLGFNLDKLIATFIPGIDVIVGGHDHLALYSPFVVDNPSGNKTYIVQTKGYYSQLGKLSLEYDTDSNQVSIADYELIELDENIPEEPETKMVVDALISEIEDTYGNVYSQQVGYATNFFDEYIDIRTDGPYDSDVGNLVTDAFRFKTGTDIAIEPGGLTARPINPGPIVPADLFRTVGYGFNFVNGLGYRIVTFKMTGLNLMIGLETALGLINPASDYAEDEFLLQVSGMKYVVDFSKDPGSRVVAAFVGNEPLDVNKSYSITGNEFLLTFMQALGLSFMDAFVYQDYTEFQALLDYVLAKQQISPEPKGRILSPKQLSVENRTTADKIPFDILFDYISQTTKLLVFETIDTPITLNLYDVLGKQVQSVTIDAKTTGTYEIKGFSNVSGPIICEIRAKPYILRKPLLIVK